jgi:hypothetical protein
LGDCCRWLCGVRGAAAEVTFIIFPLLSYSCLQNRWCWQEAYSSGRSEGKTLFQTRIISTITICFCLCLVWPLQTSFWLISDFCLDAHWSALFFHANINRASEFNIALDFVLALIPFLPVK